MQKTIHVNTTTARQNFFELYDRVQNEGLQVIIEHGKRAGGKRVVLSAQDSVKKKNKKRKEFDIMKLAGIFKIGKADPHETTKAHILHAKEQGKKYDAGLQ